MDKELRFKDINEAVEAMKAAETLELNYSLERQSESYEGVLSKQTNYRAVFVLRIQG